MSRHRACLLCGAEDQETVLLVVRWRAPLPGQPFGAIPRCVDRAGCRDRVEARGDTWEVLDAGELPSYRGVGSPRDAGGASGPQPEHFDKGSGSELADVVR